jgi:hypothetical protein
MTDRAWWCAGFRNRGAALAVLAAPVLFLAGCSGGGTSAYERIQNTQQGAREALEAKGATVVQKEFPHGTAWSVDLSGATIDGGILKQIPELGRFAELDLSGSTITDEQLAQLVDAGGLGSMVRIDVSETQISDAGLLSLASLHVLTELSVKGSNVTPAGIEEYRNKRPKHPLGIEIKIEN